MVKVRLSPRVLVVVWFSPLLLVLAVPVDMAFDQEVDVPLVDVVPWELLLLVENPSDETPQLVP